MTHHPKPVMHGRDHTPDGADPIPGLGVPDPIPGEVPLHWATATMSSVAGAAFVPANVSWSDVHSVGTTYANPYFTIRTPGLYTFQAAGNGSIDGAYTLPDSVYMFFVELLLNDAMLTQRAVTTLKDIPASFTAAQSMSLSGHASLVTGDTLALRLTSVTASVFADWHILITQLN